MKERPILFSAPMVRAILDGSKTQTRRIIKPQPPAYLQPPSREFRPVHGTDLWGAFAVYGNAAAVRSQDTITCPYGKPGDRLWVRETFTVVGYDEDRDQILGKAGPPDEPWWGVRPKGKASLFSGKWRPSLFMPRWASRITLEVVSVRVERLTSISGNDAEAEGIERCDNPDHGFINAVGGEIGRLGCPGCGGDPDGEAIKAFRRLWESINGPGSWDANPWVWVVEFKRIETESK